MHRTQEILRFLSLVNNSVKTDFHNHLILDISGYLALVESWI